MRNIKKQQVKAIHEETAEAFERTLNKALAEIAQQGGDATINFNMAAGHCAYIVYTVSEIVPETVAEHFESAGCSHRCIECPHFKPSADGRVKWVECEHSATRITKKSDWCEWAYEQLAAGRIQPREAI